MEKWAECHLTLAPEALVSPTRKREAAAKLDLRAEVPVSRAALGGEIKLVVKGKHAAELFALIQKLHEPGADVPSIVAALKELSEAEGRDSVADDGEDGGGAA